MDPIYSNYSQAVTNYTSRVFSNAHELAHFNSLKTARKCKVEAKVLKEAIISEPKEVTVVEEEVVPTAVEVVDVPVTVNAEPEVVAEEAVSKTEAPKKKRTTKKKKAETEQ